MKNIFKNWHFSLPKFQMAPEKERDLSVSNWSWREWASLIIHVAFGLIPLVYGTVSAWHFWYDMFGDGLTPTLLVGSVEAIALAGFLMYIASIESPFVHMRHGLPFVSVVGVCYELFKSLNKNNGDNWYISIPLTITVSIIFMAVLSTVYRAIENLFTDPFEKADRRIKRKVQELAISKYEFDAKERFFRQIGIIPTVTTVNAPTLPEAPVIPQLRENVFTVSPELYPLYSAILQELAIDPTLNLSVLEQKTGKARRTIQLRVQDLVNEGVLTRNGGGIYTKNGVELQVQP